MDDSASPVDERPWQFSLRSLMLATVVCAVLLVVARIIGANLFLWFAFIALALGPLFFLAKAGKTAHLLAMLTVYGPFVAMATYTLAFVDSSHCKKTTWALLPFEPGIVPYEFARHWLDFSRADENVTFVLCFVISALFALGLAWVFRTRAIWWQVPCAVAMLALGVFGAVVVLAMLRA